MRRVSGSITPEMTRDFYQRLGALNGETSDVPEWDEDENPDLEAWWGSVLTDGDVA